ncbi:MAG: acetyl-CoA carboxylase biotin carboxylase subunit family protein [Bulleidia sp.]
MNVIFISPHFPLHFYQFCDRLKRLGVNVLGIGDAPYESVSDACKNSLTEYYRVDSLEDYDAVYRGAAFFISRYGRIDYIESQNEYWLGLEARLRTDFNVPSGFHVEDLDGVRRKSEMKKAYRKAGVKTARYHLVDDIEGCQAFIQETGYPVIVKPDTGVGASNTDKLTCDDDLVHFFEQKQDVPYIMEEFVNGHVETFDGITDSHGNLLFCCGQVMKQTPLGMLKGSGENVSYSQNVRNMDLHEIGTRVVNAFQLKNRFFHFEFFRLDQDQGELGKKGDVLGLEVNMRAPGGYIPDKMNYCSDVDVYRIYAESLVFDRNVSFPDWTFRRYVSHVGRSGQIDYMYSPQEIRERYGNRILYENDPPKALSGGMGSHIWLLWADSPAEIDAQSDDILRRKDGTGWLEGK